MRLLRRNREPRVLILGLDCVPPDFVFDTFAAEMPNLSQVRNDATYGVLESSVPCITVPAWSSMTSSRDPGVMGVYGFRNRADYSYDKLDTADSRAVKVPRLWDITSAAERDNLIMAVPQTYPVNPVRGHLVAGFLTPNTSSAFTYPAVLRQELLSTFPKYDFDTKGFRTEDKAWLLQALYDLTDVQFRAFTHLLKTKPWDLAMFVNIATDRIHHGFWRYHDPQHRLHEPDSPYRHAIRDYYRTLDGFIGEVLSAIDDDVTVIVASDHGVTRMDGAIAINEWLWREGWLVLQEGVPVGEVHKLEQLKIDWSRTRAWSTGGYYGRLFLNVQGREPQGVIPMDAYEETRDELAAALRAILAPDGSALETTVFKPSEIYQQVTGAAPDLMVYFGGLHWRCVGGVGYPEVYTLENDTGPDDANHSPYGMFILREANRRGGGKVNGQQLMDIAPTVLQRMKLAIPSTMQGKIIHP